MKKLRTPGAIVFALLLILVGIASADKWTKISNENFYNEYIPAENPQSDAKIALGKKLFEEKRMSATNTVSCSTCHDSKHAFTDARKVGQGIHDLKGKRNSPSAMNAMFSDLQFWDGRAPNLEEQAKLPILNPVEMGMKTPEDVVAKIRALPEYAPLFASAFNGNSEITYNKIAQSIASFERTLVSTPAPFDRFLAGDQRAISESAKRGWSVFNGQGRCVSCHMVNPSRPLFTDNKFHNIGIAALNTNFANLAAKALAIVDTGNKEQIDNLAIESDYSDLGRFLVTKSNGDIGAFKTPNLRNIAVTGPYMHDGSLTTLWDVMDHYNKGGEVNPYLDGGITRLGLSETQISDVIEFLGTLTSPEYAAQAKADMARQRSISRTKRTHRNTALAMGKTGDNSDAPRVQDDKDPALVGGY